MVPPHANRVQALHSKRKCECARECVNGLSKYSAVYALDADDCLSFNQKASLINCELLYFFCHFYEAVCMSHTESGRDNISRYTSISGTVAVCALILFFGAI